MTPPNQSLSSPHFKIVKSQLPAPSLGGPIFEKIHFFIFQYFFSVLKIGYVNQTPWVQKYKFHKNFGPPLTPTPYLTTPKSYTSTSGE